MTEIKSVTKVVGKLPVGESPDENMETIPMPKSNEVSLYLDYAL